MSSLVANSAPSVWHFSAFIIHVHVVNEPVQTRPFTYVIMKLMREVHIHQHVHANTKERVKFIHVYFVGSSLIMF